MVAIVRLEEYEKLAYMRHFSVKATGRRTGCNSNPNSYQVQWENLCFSNLPNEVFNYLNGIHIPPSVLKVTQGQYFATQGKTKVVY